MDRWSRKSKEALQAGLWSLLRRMLLNEITSQNIADEADTGRVTFYCYYGTREELLLDMANTMEEQLKAFEESDSSSF